MKILITEETIRELGALISTKAIHIIGEKVDELVEREFVSALRASNLNDYDRVLAYLEKKRADGPKAARTRYLGTALAARLGLSALAMKRVRDKLVSEKKVFVRRHNDRLYVYFPYDDPGATDTNTEGATAN